MKKLFSTLKRKFSGKGDQAGEQSAPQSSDPDVFDEVTGKRHFEAHGDRWRALPGGPAEGGAAVAAAFTEKETTRFIRLNDTHILGFEPSSDASNAYIISTEKNSILIVSFFPLLKGLPNKVNVEAVHKWKVVENAEADLSFSHGCGASLSCFCPMFALDSPALKPGAEVTLHVAAWAYSAGKAENKPVPLNPRSPAYAQLKEKYPDREPVIHIEGSRMCLPTDYAADHNFHVPVEAVEHVDFCGFPMWKVTTTFAGETPEHGVRGHLYVSGHVLNGHVPEVGEDLEGRLWMTGYVTDPWEMFDKEG